MHISSQIIMRRCIRRHILSDPVLTDGRKIRVLDVGGADVNGSYRLLFESIGANYTSLDISAGPGVDLVLADDGRIDAPEGSFDVVVSGQTIEHCWNFWDLFGEMTRVCSSDGIIVLIAPSEGFEHRFPVDCYRFLPDSFEALAQSNDLQTSELSRSPYGPFFDLVGVFRKTPARRSPSPLRPTTLSSTAQNDGVASNEPGAEAMKGRMPAREFLAEAHRALRPRGYLETGVWMGHSLKLATCPAIGIDPFPDIRVKLEPHHQVAEVSSDEFFEEADRLADFPPIDLAYIDGLHQIENALLDFMNIEKHAHPETVVVIDDIFPNHEVQSRRRRESKAWTGDVWKIVHILREQRPDLLILPVDTHPTGSLVVTGLDPTNDQLWKVFDLLMSFETVDYHPRPSVIDRHGAIDPHDRFWKVIFQQLSSIRDRSTDSASRAGFRQLVEWSLPRNLVPVE